MHVEVKLNVGPVCVPTNNRELIRHTDMEIHCGDLEGAHIPEGYENLDWSTYWTNDRYAAFCGMRCDAEEGSSGQGCEDVSLGCYGNLRHEKCWLAKGHDGAGAQHRVKNFDFECGTNAADSTCWIDCKNDGCSVE